MGLRHEMKNRIYVADGLRQPIRIKDIPLDKINTVTQKVASVIDIADQCVDSETLFFQRTNHMYSNEPCGASDKNMFHLFSEYSSCQCHSIIKDDFRSFTVYFERQVFTGESVLHPAVIRGV